MIPLWAKSPSTPGQPGELLTAHLHNTLDALWTIRERVGAIPGMPDDFWVWAALAALLHDAGKLPHGFQRMVGNTPEPARTWGERHELLSLGFVEHLLRHLPDETRLWVGSAVAGHHRPYTAPLGSTVTGALIAQHGDDDPSDFQDRFTPADPRHLTDLLRWLHTTGRRHGLPMTAEVPKPGLDDLIDEAFTSFTRLMDRWEDPLPAGDPDGLTATLLLGAVTMADHLSSAHSPLDRHHPLTTGYPAALESRLATAGHLLRPQQRDAWHTSGHLLLRSWTGSGKTEAALLWAICQITELSQHCGGSPRLFYVLPYLASINAMTDRLEDELQANGRIGVAHSKAASYHLARSLADGCPTGEGTRTDPGGTARAGADNAARKAHSRAQATRNFRELLRVGTPYQLLRGALAGPVHAGILTDSANSVFVLDELHAYDARRLGMILAMMAFWERCGGRVAVMSATLPQALARLVADALERPVALVEAPPQAAAPVRHRLHVREHHLTDEATLAEIRAELAAGRSVLAVANNVRDAITLYEQLSPYCVELHGEDSAHLLHSRFRRMDRDRIEKAMLRRFGVGRPRRPGLLVGTQALEVSLNLDLDVCHTSAADLESLFQRFGRVNRLGLLEPAPVHIHQPVYGRRRGTGDLLWADGVYEAEPVRLGWDLLAAHHGRTVDEKTVTSWLDTVYASPWGERWRHEVDNHRARFQEAFLTFTAPFADRSHLADVFDEQFDGAEAILSTDREAYETALNAAPDRSTSRLSADRFLIPLPHWAGPLSSYERRLKVRIIDGDYTPERGLLTVHSLPQSAYQPGEVL